MVSMSGAAAEPSRSARQELVKTLVEHSWARPDALRPTARPHIVLMAAIATAAAAIAFGAVLQLVHPGRHGRTAGPSPPTSSFTAVTGWGCRRAADYGFLAQGSTSNWYTVPSGGWAHDGCHGQFESIPMTGLEPTAGQNQIAEWWFTPPAAMTRCAVSVFRPAPDQRGLAASAAQFYVLDGRHGTQLAGFVLDEAVDPGTWAAAGSFPIGQNGIAVELADRGVPALAGVQLAITQVRVACTT